jgi:hypothetical protein
MPAGTAGTETTSLSIKRIEAQPVNTVKAKVAKAIKKHRLSGSVAERMACLLEVHIEMT